MASTPTGPLTANALPESVRDDIDRRLARIEGQIRGLRRLLGEDSECEQVIHQLAAAGAALDRVGYRLIAAGMEYCVANPDSPMTAADLEKLFLKLS
ncbi:MAG: metal-sensitive transcriptional regulator [Actinomycetota bacterium]